jgi:hypothetical protein
MTSSTGVGRLRVAVVAGVALAGVGVAGVAAVVALTAYDQERDALEPAPFVLPGGQGVWDDELHAFVAEHGGFPPHDPYSADELARGIEADARYLTEFFLLVHPGAAVPPASFIAFDEAARASCLGRTPTPGEINPRGMLARFPVDLAEATTTYGCFIEYPPYPDIPTDVQSHWQYAYLVDYVAACYEAHGLPQTPPPPEDVYVSHWPRTWYPQPPTDYYSFLDAMGYPLCPDLADRRELAGPY